MDLSNVLKSTLCASLDDKEQDLKRCIEHFKNSEGYSKAPYMVDMLQRDIDNIQELRSIFGLPPLFSST